MDSKIIFLGGCGGVSMSVGGGSVGSHRKPLQ